MKITKLIREYVEEKVTAIYAPKIAALDAQEKQEASELELARARIQQILDEAEAKAIMCIETEFPNYIRRPKRWHRDEPAEMFHISNNPKYENLELEEARKALISERARAIKNILTDLELGATRKDLDEMIAKLMVEG